MDNGPDEVLAYEGHQFAHHGLVVAGPGPAARWLGVHFVLFLCKQEWSARSEHVPCDPQPTLAAMVQAVLQCGIGRHRQHQVQTNELRARAGRDDLPRCRQATGDSPLAWLQRHGRPPHAAPGASAPRRAGPRRHARRASLADVPRVARSPTVPVPLAQSRSVCSRGKARPTSTGNSGLSPLVPDRLPDTSAGRCRRSAPVPVPSSGCTRAGSQRGSSPRRDRPGWRGWGRTGPPSPCGATSALDRPT